MAQADFEAAIAGVRSGAGATEELDQQTFFSQFQAAIAAERATADDASPAARKLDAMAVRVTQRQSEVSDKGAGLIATAEP